MITIERLFQIDSEMREEMLHGPAELHPQFRRIKESALALAEYLMDNNFLEGHIGLEDFCTIKLKRGDVVRLRAGAWIHSTHPQRRGGYFNPKNRQVKVFSMDQGWINRHEPKNSREPIVKWVGAGGYWFWTNLSNVEVI